MKNLCVSLVVFSLMFSCVTMNTLARNVQTTIVGGTVHMNGSLVGGGCIVVADSQDMHIDMGQYTTHSFDHVGESSTQGVPFTLRLTGCSPDMADKVGIAFTGMTAPKDPDLFLVTSADGGPTGVSGNDGFSGLGLMISDSKGHQIVPGQHPVFFYPVVDREVALHYIARYRATSRYVYPGPLGSNIRFDISYP